MLNYFEYIKLNNILHCTILQIGSHPLNDVKYHCLLTDVSNIANILAIFLIILTVILSLLSKGQTTSNAK